MTPATDHLPPMGAAYEKARRVATAGSISLRIIGVPGRNTSHHHYHTCAAVRVDHDSERVFRCDQPSASALCLVGCVERFGAAGVVFR